MTAIIDDAGDWWTEAMRRYVSRSRWAQDAFEAIPCDLADAARRVVAEQPPFEPVIQGVRR